MPQRPTAPALRIAVVATTAAAAAALSVLPTATAAPAPDSASATAPTVSRDVAPAAGVLPAAPGPAAQTAAAASSAAAPAAQAAAVRSSALSTAMSQIGKPYSYGADGPSAFDCSGLVSYAFSKAGKDVPRSSSAQASAGTEVSKSNLKPGDLVFFYKPVSHVGIYAGDGQVVHASTSGQPVKVSDMDAMPFNSARRI